MTLIEGMMERATLLSPENSTLDGEGGQNVRYYPKSEFMAAFAMTNPVNAAVAEKAVLQNTFTITTARDNPLKFNDIVRRESDSRCFRVTSDGNDRKVPAGSDIYPFSQVNAEEWKVPQ